MGERRREGARKNGKERKGRRGETSYRERPKVV